MEKAFAVANLSVWALGLLVGIGFAVVGEVNGTDALAGRIFQLKTESQSLAIERDIFKDERDSFLESVKSERNRANRYRNTIGREE
jgi:hypothetical protein